MILGMLAWPGMWRLVIAAVVAITAASSVAAQPAKPSFGRLALVIGNNRYQHLPPLTNAVNDARSLQNVLQQLGFDVTLLVDASKRDIDRQIGILVERLRGNNVGLFFFAGHGIRVQQKNYLIGVDADIAIERDVRREGIDANSILLEMQSSGNPTNFLILDACRDNPLARTRNNLRGLAPMEAPSGARGFLIAFSAGPGEPADDGPPGRNSVYTEELIRNIQRRQISAKAAFDDTAEAVARKTNGRQNPWISKSPIGDFFFKEGRIEHERVDLALSDPNLPCLTSWNRVKDSKNAGDFEWFLQRFPVCSVAAQARKKMDELLKAAKSIAASTSELAPKSPEPARPSPVSNIPMPVPTPTPKIPKKGAEPPPSQTPQQVPVPAVPVPVQRMPFDGQWQGTIKRADGSHDPQLQNICRSSNVELTVDQGKVQQGRLTMDNQNTYELGAGKYGRVEIDGDVSSVGFRHGIKMRLFDNWGSNFINFVFRSPLASEHTIEGTWADQLNRCHGSFALHRTK